MSVGKPHFGRCEVEFTPIPIINQVAPKCPFYIKRETNRVSADRPKDSALFWMQVRAAVEQISSGSLVLFVHGYNYGFERTCRMAAEMQRSLKEKPLSWYSAGRPTR